MQEKFKKYVIGNNQSYEWLHGFGNNNKKLEFFEAALTQPCLAQSKNPEPGSTTSALLFW